MHYSVQRDHIHLLVESESRDALSRGLKGLQVRIARALNKRFGKSGKVFVQRYHEHILKTPQEVRNAVKYVLLNSHKHGAQESLDLADARLDPCASGIAFGGWSEPVRSSNEEQPPVAKSQTWLLNVGWKKGGLIAPHEIPSRPKKGSKNPRKSDRQS